VDVIDMYAREPGATLIPEALPNGPVIADGDREDADHGDRRTSAPKCLQLHAALRAISVESKLHLGLGQYGNECGINACHVVELARAGATSFEVTTNHDHEMHIGDASRCLQQWTTAAMATTTRQHKLATAQETEARDAWLTERECAAVNP